MPREAHGPRSDARPKSILSPQKGSTRIPLNDDKQEKSVRFKSRQAMQELQMNQIKAAASPAKRRISLGNPESPRTPNSQDKENDALGVVGGNAVTPMKRVPILANFEEWMKMATDNKINAANSWNFALIDYFHDMSLLKEGDSVNFQKASCTLDGCVKIYTSRVDSVATETGKLLSGLADSGNKKRKGEDVDAEHGEGEGEEEGEDAVKKRARKRAQRSSETTLATSFAQLQLKKMELEFSVDPLFKKASADFDEGGAKGLLLNHLTIDAQGRIVFDSSDDAQDPAAESPATPSNEPDDEAAAETVTSTVEDIPTVQPEVEVDISALGQRFFPDLNLLNEQDICPSLKTFELGAATDSLDLPFLKAPEDWKKDVPEKKPEGLDNALPTDDGVAFGVDDDDDDVGGGFDIAADVGFGEGGEAWAREAAIETQTRPYNGGYDQDMGDGPADDRQQEVGAFDPNSSQYGVHLSRDKDFDRENILSYFDQALQKNWAGPEHWRIRKIKDATKSAPATKRKEKELFEIDFATPMSQALADLLYTQAASNAAISLPKSQWKSKTRNLLPDDKHFNSKQLLSLFLKPKARIGSRRLEKSSSSLRRDQLPEGELDEAYWARQQNEAVASHEADESMAQGNYDANFFQDDGLGAVGMADDDDDGVEFADAQERLSPGLDGQPLRQGSIDSIVPEGGTQADGGFGSQLVTQSRRLRPEYVQYARVAKKVDVRRLKEEMWRGIGFKQPSPVESPVESPLDSAKKDANSELKFTSVMNNLKAVYPKQAMDDISTSFCFICLLHLANEKGLTLNHDQTFEEISIQQDHTALITDAGD